MRINEPQWKIFPVNKNMSKVLNGVCLAVLVFTALLSATGIARGSQTKMSDAQIVQDLRNHLNRLVAQERFSGAVLVAKNGKIIFENAYGYADKTANVTNRLDTQFGLASMGKMFTGVSILQLAQAGKLSLDDKLIKYLPDYPNREAAKEITLRQVLTHTAGIGDFMTPEFAAADKSKLQTPESLLPFFASKPLLFPPGTGWQYSNGGYIVLGLVIERLSGQSYYAYLEDHIFKPAGMTSTGDCASNAPNRGRGNQGVQRVRMPEMRGGPAGGGCSTVGDLFRFAQALQGGRLLDRKYTEIAITGQVAAEFMGAGTKYGFGMEERTVNGVRIVGHDGTGGGINTNLDIYPDLGYTVSILSNVDGGSVLANSRLRWQLTGKELPQAIRLSAEALNSVAGKYAVSEGPGWLAMSARRPVAAAADTPVTVSGQTPVIVTGRTPAVAEGPIVRGRGQGTMRGDGPTQGPVLDFVARDEGLFVEIGFLGTHYFVPLSATEFVDYDDPDVRLTLTGKGKGQITGLRFMTKPMSLTKQP